MLSRGHVGWMFITWLVVGVGLHIEVKVVSAATTTTTPEPDTSNVTQASGSEPTTSTATMTTLETTITEAPTTATEPSTAATTTMDTTTTTMDTTTTPMDTTTTPETTTTTAMTSTTATATTTTTSTFTTSGVTTMNPSSTSTGSTTSPSTITPAVPSTPAGAPTPAGASLSTGEIVGIAIGVVCIFLLIIIVCLVVNSWFNIIPDPSVAKPALDKFNQSVLKLPPKSKPIKIATFEEQVEMMAVDQNRMFAEDFEELKEAGRSNKNDVSLREENIVKNRYRDILPYDHSRVKLMSSEEPGSDYINANWMPGHVYRREYICAQGPLPHTVVDFWRMIWEHQCPGIIMLTNCRERMRVKCELYWPQDSEPLYFDDIVVQSENIRQNENWTITKIAISKGHRLRHMTHYHYTTWPDMDVPDENKLLDFVGMIRKDLRKRDGPLVVHCSAGVGRTGAYIAIDRGVQVLDDQYSETIDIYGTVYEMRYYRVSMVQTESQYVFIFKCLANYLRTRTADPEYRDSMPSYANMEYTAGAHPRKQDT